MAALGASGPGGCVASDLPARPGALRWGPFPTRVAVALARGQLTAASLTAAFAVAFLFAPPAASAAYLTVAESFPLEVRGLTIAAFYALGTAFGGVAAPWLFGRQVVGGRPLDVASGYGVGAVLMVAAAAVDWRLAVPAERRPLESVARPLSAVD